MDRGGQHETDVVRSRPRPDGRRLRRGSTERQFLVRDAPTGGGRHGGQADAPYPRLDGALNAVLTSDRPLETAVERGLRVQEERIQVTISTAAPLRVESLSGWLSEQGAHNLSSAGGEVQADVSVELLRALAERDEVLSVRRPAAIRDPALH